MGEIIGADSRAPNRRRTILTLIVGGVVVALVSFALARGDSVAAATDPKGAKEMRRAYFPGTEELAPDEMRIIACGTGSPQARLKQAAACFLVQLGNGDNLIFDMGAGSNERLVSLDIPTDETDKVFIGHLHLDHVGDLPDFYFTRAVNNGTTPLRVWGPSGVRPEWGMKAAMENMKKMYGWERAMRGALMAEIPLEVSEFDWKGINQVIYDESGATVRSIPAVHGDQSVSFILEYKGLKFAFSSDTVPNKYWVQYTKGVDVSVHECFFAPEEMVSVIGFAPAEALNVATQVHTPPQGFAHVMALTRPRLAVAYHFHNDFDSVHKVRHKIRETYDGPLDMATDFMVWNVTKEKITTRLAVVSPEHIAPKRTGPKVPGDPKSYQYDELTLTGMEPSYLSVVQKIYDDFNKKHGTSYKPLLRFEPPPGAALDQ